MNIPVLFIIFNRPDTTELVFKEIAKIKPQRLYIAADGARERKQGERNICEQTRRIAQNVNWKCVVKTLFQKENIGCGRAVSQAISWFFENEEMGIILEDDCLPHPTFFSFCEELLVKYKDDDRISVISGNNFQMGHKRGRFSYYFSDIVNMWGWATWARNWEDFKLNVNDLDEKHIFNEIKKRFPEKTFSDYWLKVYEQMKNFKVDTWDYQFYFSQIARGRMFIVPSVNLVSNIGFGNDATHTFDKHCPSANIPTQAMECPLRHPTKITTNHKADKFLFYNFLVQRKTFLKKVTTLKKIISHKGDRIMVFRKLIRRILNKAFPYKKYRHVSYSQTAEDLLIDFLLSNEKRPLCNGFYVDVGAHHPFRFSNTAIFYERGWRGINIEPDPLLIQNFNKHRVRDINLNFGVGMEEKDLKFFIFNEPALNTFSEERAKEIDSMDYYSINECKMIPVRKLSTLLEEYLPQGQKIDFMSIDVEGLDLEVLKSNDWEKFRPSFILVETHLDGNDDISKFLKQHHYKYTCCTPFTSIFQLDYELDAANDL